MAQLQNILIDRGYITSRILAPQQDLKSGVFTHGGDAGLYP